MTKKTAEPFTDAELDGLEALWAKGITHVNAEQRLLANVRLLQGANKAKADNFPTEDEHCWCGEHNHCPNPEPEYCYERIQRTGKDPRPYR